MKKIIPILVALFLILIVGGFTVGGMLMEKYSYSEERADLKEYFEVEGNELAIILQDTRVEEKAILKDGVCYFDLDTVHKYFNDGYYIDLSENIMLYTTALTTTKVNLGEAAVYVDDVRTELPYVPVYADGETIYVSADYVKRFTNMSYEVFDLHVQVYTEWGTRVIDYALKDTAVRYRGGIKSEILCDLPAGSEVEILEVMKNWAKVKTADSIIGYVENKLLENTSKDQGLAYEETPVTDYVEEEYTTQQLEGKVCLGWHSIGGVGGNDTLYSMVENTKGMNVIAPTWFSLSDNYGNFESYGTTDYVQKAHDMGLEVWGVLDDFNYKLNYDSSVDVNEVLKSSMFRGFLIENIIDEALRLGIDGINLDFEKVDSESGEHFAQFIRELSVQCRKNELTFSIDNYVPFNFNEYMRRDVQGKFADYVIIMGYDEHWHGSGDPGSVASIDYVSSGIDKTLEQVPVEKIINAVPFYSILWKTEGATVTDEYLTMNNTADFLERVGQAGTWDEETQQNYYEWQSGSALYQLWAEDEQSISVKLNVMRTKGIAGVAVWRLGYGTPKVWEMINAYVNS